MAHKYMFAICAVGVLFCVTLLSAADTGNPKMKELKILAIGNSFSESLKSFFPKVVSSVPGYAVVFENIHIGGCSMKTHWENIEKEESDPTFKYFKKWSYREKLQSRKWDIITIQQASYNSWDYETYLPYARKLYNYIKKWAPQAKIFIQQTWSYRPDNQRLAGWGFDRDEMYRRLDKAYMKIARELNVPLIPVGLAVQIALQTQPVKYKPFNPADYKYPALPDMSGSLIGNIEWSDDKKTLKGDTIHLNKRGQYLQACVWFSSLFDCNASKITYVPRGITAKDAVFLRKVAQQAVDQMKTRKEK